ncbi:zinc-binding dehydrogenase [Chitinophagales bacterium]|nr:zinc-binding dehydrogenase [Chitinophagales bacterium]
MEMQQAAVLVKTGKPSDCFELRSVPIPEVGPQQVRIKAEAFGLNFADIMARKGLYDDCPKLPTVIGYDVVGRVDAVGAEVSDFQIGQRVTALTRFGGYAEYAVTMREGVAAIPDDMPIGTALALSTQYCTAYFSAAEMINLFPGDKVLVQAAAGGVGTALVQWAKHRGCEVFGTASKQKFDHIRAQGVDHPIDYRNQDFKKEIEAIAGKNSIDAVFDAIGGSSVKKGWSLLNSGGRFVSYGASDLTTSKTLFGKLGTVLGFGLFHPIQFLQGSKAFTGVNMLRIADNKPQTFERVLKEVIRYTNEGVFKPVVAEQQFSIKDVGAAHAYMESRKSIGKIVVVV